MMFLHYILQITVHRKTKFIYYKYDENNGKILKY